MLLRKVDEFRDDPGEASAGDGAGGGPTGGPSFIPVDSGINEALIEQLTSLF